MLIYRSDVISSLNEFLLRICAAYFKNPTRYSDKFSPNSPIKSGQAYRTNFFRDFFGTFFCQEYGKNSATAQKNGIFFNRQKRDYRVKIISIICKFFPIFCLKS